MAIGQGLLAATPLQVAVGYSTFANGGSVLQPHVVQAILEPGDARRRARLRRHDPGHGAVQIAPAVARQIPMTPRAARPDPGRHPPQHHRARATTAATHDGRGAVRSTTRADAIQVAGKTGTAQGASSYPWNDSSVFAAYSLDPDAAVHRRRLPREVGVRIAGRGARREVHVPGAVERPAPLDPVQVSETLDVTQRRGGAGPAATSTHALHGQRSDAGTVRAAGLTRWRSRCCSASRTPGSATSARARPTRAGTSTGC